MSAAFLTVAAVALAGWFYLLLGRGFFWLPRTLQPAPLPAQWPSVAAIVPARDEASVIGAAITSLLKQDYPGSFRVVLVDDHSSDGTAAIARAAAAAIGQAGSLSVVRSEPLPPGWSGKLWALTQGVRHCAARDDLYLFTDADIAHHPTNLVELVAQLEASGRDLVSLMVLLRCRSLVERFLVPAFVFFFGMLYPFAWASDPRRRTAAAAGGCILLRRSAYERIGGYASIRDALIDDCALARAVKRNGAIALAMTRQTHSLRAYPRFRDVWAMVARTAYTQLGHSPLVLLATVLGLVLTYLAPPVLIADGGLTAWLAGAAWAAMAVAFTPMLRFYGLSALWAPLLPVMAAIYLCATLDSACRHWRGRGGEWKGRLAWRSQR